MSEDRVERLIQQVQALQLEVTNIQQELKQHNRCQQASPTTSPSHPTVTHNLLQPGDRVRILNQVKKTRSWDTTREFIHQQAKLATVTAVVNNRIYFTTDNGIHTWRSRRNIIKQPKQPNDPS
jgi:hypothetical protein